MDDFTTTIAGFISDHRAWAGPIMFVLAFSESLAFLSLLVPSTALMLTTGALIGAGLVDPIPVLIGGILGAILGDAVSFWIGRWLGPRTRKIWPFRDQPRMLAQGRLFFRRWGWASIMIGRFFGPMRAVVPLVAGMMRMRERRFQSANILSAILWVPLMFAPGWLGLESIGGADALDEGTLLIIGIVPVAFGFLLVYIAGRVIARASRPPPGQRGAGQRGTGQRGTGRATPTEPAP